jgi:hypothetical protein
LIDVCFCTEVEILHVEILIVSAKDLNIHEKYIETAES